MRKLLIGMFAGLLGASTALAGQNPLSNYNAAFTAPASKAAAVSQNAHPRARMQNATVRSGGFTLKSSPQNRISGRYDSQLGKPTFLWASSSIKPAVGAPLKGSQIAESAAREYLSKQASVLQLSKNSISSAKLMQMQDLKIGPHVARFQQMYKGIEVFGRQMNVLMDRNLKLVATSGYFAPHDTANVLGKNASEKAGDSFSIAPERAVALAFTDFSGQPLNSSALTISRKAGNYSVYKMNGTQRGEIRLESEPRTKQVYFYLDGKYEPAYYVEVAGRTVDGADSYAYGYVISAKTGKVLFRKNQIDYDFTYRAYADTTGINHPFDSPLGNALEPFTGTAPNGVQQVPRTGAATNLVTLDHGPISTNDPWLPAGATVTTGNNVEAYLDLEPGDGFTDGTTDRRAATTGAATFDYPYTPDADPTTASQGNFAVVNQFYIDNWLHDWWYDNGFNELAGNAQNDNFGRGGMDGDSLRAEGQDYSGRNNANESTPADGGRPRQQMFLFDGQPVIATVRGITPAFGDLEVGTASFGPRKFDVTGTAVASAPLDGCTALTNGATVSGNIVLINRGGCTFALKAANAQAAGATAVIIANNAAGAAPGLGGTDPTITIGTLSLSQSDGQIVRDAITAGPTVVREVRDPGIDIDGTVDIQVIAHEWFHTTSNRLVGDGAGLSSQQGGGMGEGWSDFSAQMLTVRPEDQQVSGNDRFQGAYPSGYYVTRDGYFGIRRYPYSTSLTINPLTFADISDGVPLPTTAPVAFGQNGASNSEVHNTGEVWCNTLWEIYAALLNDPRYTFTQAQELMKSYVIAGLMMTPNAPTVLEARDALLAAARATDTTGADFRLMATAFAKRGMGAGAIAPDRASPTNAGAVEDFTAFAGSLTVTNAALDFTYFNGAAGFIDNDGVLDPGETALMTITVMNNGTAAITTPVVGNLSSDGDVTFGGPITFPASASAPIGIGETATATVTVKLNSATATAQALTLTVTFADSGATADAVFEPQPVTFDLSVNYDIAPNTRAADDLEQPQASVIDWSRVVIGDGQSNWQIADGNDPALAFDTGLLWYVPDNGGTSDVRLTTPPLQVGANGFSMAFDHYFQFELAGAFADGTLVGYDGGVIEISDDNGATWTDVVDAGGTFTSGNGYNGVFIGLDADGTPTPDDSTQNPHAGFVDNNFATNNGFLESVVLSFGTDFASKTVRLRFREVSDVGTGDFGWAVDNIGFTGITNQPFSSVVVEDNVPDNQPPVANAGADNLAIVANTVATLDGNGSTDDAGPTNLSYQWVQLSGPPVTLINANAAIATYTPSAFGTRVFQLTVTDQRAASSTDTVTQKSLGAGGGAIGLWFLVPGFGALLLRRRRRK